MESDSEELSSLGRSCVEIIGGSAICGTSVDVCGGVGVAGSTPVALVFGVWGAGVGDAEARGVGEEITSVAKGQTAPYYYSNPN